MSSVSFSPSFPLSFLQPSYGEQTKRIFWTTYALGMEKTRVVSVEILKLTIMVTTVSAVAACVFATVYYSVISLSNLLSTYISLEEQALAENRDIEFFTELSIRVRIAALVIVLGLDAIAIFLTTPALIQLLIIKSKKLFKIAQETYNEVKNKRNLIHLALSSEKNKTTIIIFLNQLKNEIIPQIEAQLKDDITEKDAIEEEIKQISIFLNDVINAPLFKEKEDLFTPYCCPITCALPTIPMKNQQAKETYFDKKAILEWLEKDLTCPATRTPMCAGDLTYDLTPFNEVISIVLSNLSP